MTLNYWANAGACLIRLWCGGCARLYAYKLKTLVRSTSSPQPYYRAILKSPENRPSPQNTQTSGSSALKILMAMHYLT